MKLVVVSLITFFCYSYSGAFAQIDTSSLWTWMKGDTIVDQFGIYGTQGIPSSANKPGSRGIGAHWTDTAGNFWIFGGSGYVSSGFTGNLNDLWRYSPFNNQWTWMKGDNATYRVGVYGTKGVPALANKPGSRYSSVSWNDASGKFWLFGGVGYAKNAVSNYLNDLWCYDPATNMWTWINGSDVGVKYSVYGNKGIADINNTPGSRSSCYSWPDSAGNLWIFGGYGLANTTGGELNDLWKYDMTANQWTWINGDSVADMLGNYGTLGVPAMSNKPGGRAYGNSWLDVEGKMWLYGGRGITASFSNQGLDDVWRYDPELNQWTFMKGTGLNFQHANWGSLGVTASTNSPGSRYGCASWRDAGGDFYIFSGYGYTSTSSILNDTWKYEPDTNQWTWVKGDSIPYPLGRWGTQGVPSPLNKPGGRLLSYALWIDQAEDIWIFGGHGFDNFNELGDFNDVWRIKRCGFTWTGITNTDWTEASNWCGGLVPGSEDDVVIPGSTPFSLVIPDGIIVACRSLTTTTDAIVTIAGHGKINIMH